MHFLLNITVVAWHKLAADQPEKRPTHKTKLPFSYKSNKKGLFIFALMKLKDVSIYLSICCDLYSIQRSALPKVSWPLSFCMAMQLSLHIIRTGCTTMLPVLL